jgi:hypothetical protein
MNAVTQQADPPRRAAPLLAALRALPKVELHCHVEGTMRPATVVITKTTFMT